MRIGFVEYINALPFTLAFKMGHMPDTLIPTYAIPSKLNASLKDNALDVALTSSVEYLDGPYQLLRGYGIAAHEEILSVNLYYQKSSSLKEIALTHHSATSVSLLKVLLHHWGVRSQFVPLDRNQPLESNEAFLLIGDEALGKEFLGYETIDLAKAWYEMTHLPFVFAVFSIRKNVSHDEIVFLQECLEKSLAWSKANFETLIEFAHSQTGISKPLIRRYYGLCKYRLYDKEMEGLLKFKELRTRLRSSNLDVQAVGA